ncbi:hypothetical protein C2845_PM15G18420 [Panicum miliaceum]|uniref:RNase H type-1 domain-containing protein n=1 Tax=Panicum miliaceum TaxID=4540 RepID=A0A3L6Q3W8_PANMI|nr:hypothetical protein C2845_PM15G18420 [Panicum miliaceum]
MAQDFFKSLYTRDDNVNTELLVSMLQERVRLKEVEALACKEGLTLAAKWTTFPTTLECDCSTMIKYLSHPEAQRSASLFTIKEALEEAGKLPRIVFFHVGRELNSVAHALAQLAKCLNHYAVWRNRFPFCVEHLVARDVNPQVN